MEGRDNIHGDFDAMFLYQRDVFFSEIWVLPWAGRRSDCGDITTSVHLSASQKFSMVIHWSRGCTAVTVDHRDEIMG